MRRSGRCRSALQATARGLKPGPAGRIQSDTFRIGASSVRSRMDATCPNLTRFACGAPAGVLAATHDSKVGRWGPNHLHSCRKARAGCPSVHCPGYAGCALERQRPPAHLSLANPGNRPPNDPSVRWSKLGRTGRKTPSSRSGIPPGRCRRNLQAP